MRLKVIIGVFAIVGFTSLLMYNFANSISTYTNFEKASERESAHVVGQWVESKPHGFSMKTKKFNFYMKDQKGNVRRVIYAGSKPNNFERAKKIVVIGSMQNGIFYANEMLIKCPSKYNNASASEFKKVSTK